MAKAQIIDSTKINRLEVSSTEIGTRFELVTERFYVILFLESADDLIEIRDTIQDYMDGLLADEPAKIQSMQEKLTEVGMSEKDFL